MTSEKLISPDQEKSSSVLRGGGSLVVWETTIRTVHKRGMNEQDSH